MAVQPATPRITCYNLCIPIMDNPPLVALLRLKLHESCCDIPMLGVGELRCTGCFSLLEVLIAPPEREMVEPTGSKSIVHSSSG